MMLIDDRALRGESGDGNRASPGLAADGALPSCPGAGRRVAGFARAAKGAIGRHGTGFLRAGGIGRIPFFFGLLPVNLSKCRLLAAKVQENSRAKWVRAELRTSPAEGSSGGSKTSDAVAWQSMLLPDLTAPSKVSQGALSGSGLRKKGRL
jgi:hypothetical protein